ncbi:hypothetical protein F2P56_033985 [Juglans regia]|uniref:Protein FAR1-RELATED SEQUENCE n=2 Tax=Juglans regia TaxID=51240 RepID=A0A2I4EKC2_JUGRE|nr:protein FAR1-RELATED SEQUENCE 5-like [Juglans regia]KAF5444893.1 hypothetical protein F2P56_033985 [Juglans regia]
MGNGKEHPSMLTPLINTSSTTSILVGSDPNRPGGGETEAPCTSSTVEEINKDRPNPQETKDCSAGTSQNVEIDCDDMIEEPKSRMEFDSLQDLVSYYKEYGKKWGFGVMTKRTEREEDDFFRYVTLTCACGGKACNRTFNVVNPRPTGKTECKAKINALKSDGKLQLTTVHNIHNHGLSPKKSRFFRYNREVSDAVKRVLDTNDMAGVRMNKSFGSLVVGTGGDENLPFLEKDCCNYIDNARHLRLGAGGAGALRKYFCRMQYKNPGFFALMDLDDEGRLKNVFWADPRSRAAYQYFGDVVTFDTTYLTNRYGMPFAPFVGVNHHGQSILLGAGLISSEDTEIFVWLFQTWLQCMDGIAPKAIITDQDRAMKNAIGIVFPNTQHRFCLWHILKKVPEKLGSYGSYKTGMKNALMKCVYDSQSIDEFETSWVQLITTYNLHECTWLQSLYADREHWVPAFLKDCFWARMSTTQLSESMNAFFDRYVNAKTNLKEFVDQFDNALRKKIENENAADFHSFSVTTPCISRSPIEKRFQELYTNSKFKEVQQQVTGMIDMNPKLHKSIGAIQTYLVKDEVHLAKFTKQVTYSVDFIEEDSAAKCSCGLFQMRGILCRHILAVFRCNEITYLPDSYFLDRWRKDIKWRYTLINSSYNAGEQRADSNRYSEMLNICYQMIILAAGSKEHTQDAKAKLYAMIELYRANQEPPSLTQTGSNVPISTGGTTTVSGSGQGDVGGTPMLSTQRSLFGHEENELANARHVQANPENTAFDIGGTQIRGTVIQSQERMQIGLNGSQPIDFGLDGSQPFE